MLSIDQAIMIFKENEPGCKISTVLSWHDNYVIMFYEKGHIDGDPNYVSVVGVVNKKTGAYSTESIFNDDVFDNSEILREY